MESGVQKGVFWKITFVKRSGRKIDKESSACTVDLIVSFRLTENAGANIVP
jgi:hypothetical protein